MKHALGKYLLKHEELAYVLVRIIVGFLFLFHGAQKLGLLSGGFKLEGFMGFIGVAELLGGTAILLGFLTRIAAVGCIIIMIGAYATAHAPNGILPIANRGELALLYLAIFILIAVHGAKKFSLEHMLFGKEVV